MLVSIIFNFILFSLQTLDNYWLFLYAYWFLTDQNRIPIVRQTIRNSEKESQNDLQLSPPPGQFVAIFYVKDKMPYTDKRKFTTYVYIKYLRIEYCILSTRLFWNLFRLNKTPYGPEH